MKLPSKLERSPLLDALFEIRFKPIRAGTGDLLPGILYSQPQDEYNNIERLPLSQFPAEIRESDPALFYQPHYRLTSNTGALQVGDRVVTYSHSFPYPGWEVFSKNVFGILDVLSNVEFVREVERFSLRFINLIEDDERTNLSALDVKLEIAGTPIADNGLFLRFEMSDSLHLSIVQISPKTSADIPSVGNRNGLLVDIDTLRDVDYKEFWEQREAKIEECHVALKTVFFSIVRSEIVESWEPTWTR